MPSLLGRKTDMSSGGRGRQGSRKNHPVRGPPGRQQSLSREITSLPVQTRPNWRVPTKSEQGRPNGTKPRTAQTTPHHNPIKNNSHCTPTPPTIPQSLPLGFSMCILGKDMCTGWNGHTNAPVNQMTSPCQSERYLLARM